MKSSSKQPKIQYNFSGEWDDVSSFLRKYSTENVLKEINKVVKKYDKEGL